MTRVARRERPRTSFFRLLSLCAFLAIHASFGEALSSPEAGTGPKPAESTAAPTPAAPVAEPAPAPRAPEVAPPPQPSQSQPSQSQPSQSQPSQSQPSQASQPPRAVVEKSGPRPLPTQVAKAEVRLGDEVLVTLGAPLGQHSAEARANTASAALAALIADKKYGEVRVERRTDRALVWVAGQLVLELSESDAKAARSASLDSLAASVEQRLEAALAHEKRRTAITQTAFSVALSIFLGLLLLYLLRKVRSLTTETQEWLEDNPERVPALKLLSFEVLGAGPMRSGLLVTIGVGRWLVQFGLAYAYLVVVLSLFESTRGLTQRLTGFVVAPFSALTTRLAQSLPVLFVAALGALALFLLVRLVGLFFASIARGETQLAGVPREFARPLGVLVRTALVLVAVVFVAPVVTGDPEGPLSRTGMLALAGLGLASLPLLSAGIVGAVTLFLQKLPVGSDVEFGGRVGRVQEVGMLDVRLVDPEGADVRVPHLLGLVHPTRILTRSPVLALELQVPRSVERTAVERALRDAGERPQGDLGVHVVGMSQRLVRYRVSIQPRITPNVGLNMGEMRSQLVHWVAITLEEAHIEVECLTLL